MSELTRLNSVLVVFILTANYLEFVDGSTERIETPQKSVPSSHNNENLHGCASSKVESSPLSLVSCELKLSDSSRIRKPIYVAPSLHDGTEIDI